MPWTLVSLASVAMLAPDVEPTISIEEDIITEENSQEKVDENTENSKKLVSIYFFEQDRYGHCRAEKEFFNKYLASEPTVHLVYYDVAENEEHW